MTLHEPLNQGDPDSAHYERANLLTRYQSVKHLLSPQDKFDWLDAFETALAQEVQYAADNRNDPRKTITEQENH